MKEGDKRLNLHMRMTNSGCLAMMKLNHVKCPRLQLPVWLYGLWRTDGTFCRTGKPQLESQVNHIDRQASEIHLKSFIKAQYVWSCIFRSNLPQCWFRRKMLIISVVSLRSLFYFAFSWKVGLVISVVKQQLIYKCNKACVLCAKHKSIQGYICLATVRGVGGRGPMWTLQPCAYHLTVRERIEWGSTAFVCLALSFTFTSVWSSAPV